MPKSKSTNLPVPTVPTVPTTANTTTSITKAAVSKQTKFIDILTSQHNFDLVSSIISHIGEIKRAKKIKPIEKHRMLQTYYMALMQFAYPKMKVVEDNSAGSQKPINFTISIAAPAPEHPAAKPRSKPKGYRTSITVPTYKNTNGTYTIKDEELSNVKKANP